MELKYKQKGKNYTGVFKPTKYIGVDLDSHNLTEATLFQMKEIEYVGYCDFKGDILTGIIPDDVHFCNERVVFFGIIE